jgi:hypothetical protein
VPAIADIDNDGRNELVIMGSQWTGQSGYFDHIWVYDLGGPAHGSVHWGQYMGGPRHQGWYIPPYGFADVPVTNPAFNYIRAIAKAGVTAGCSTNPPRYCPNDTLLRSQMSVFLEKAKRGSTYSPAACVGTMFNDVPLGSFACKWIELMATDGITVGCGGGNFCPNNTITQAEMAIFILKAKYGAGVTHPTCTGTLFTDVPLGSFACAAIERAATEGIMPGCGGGNFCPTSPVTREQMAVYLQRTFDLPFP